MESEQYSALIGTGGIGSGIFFALEGDHTLGRNESRAAMLSTARDFCKLHIICHYVAVLLRSDSADSATFQTITVGRVGEDETGREMLELMRRTGMDTALVRKTPGAATLFSVCFQYPDSAGGNITTARSASSRVSPADIREAEPLFRKYSGRGLALAAPEVPLESRLELLRLAAEYGFRRFFAFNSAEIADPLALECLRNTDCLALNRDEAESLVKRDFSAARSGDFLAAVQEKLEALNPDLQVMLTIGALGAYGYDKGTWEYTPCALVNPISTAGAGDAALGALIAGTARGLPFILKDRAKRHRLAEAPLESALDLAALVASFSVLSPDTINLETSPTALREHAGKLGLTFSEAIEKILR
ncbi:MAG: hypothetical protein A3F83_07830 [Candidatus Glassbacteria bacterium RIFCSPLOWO2_12_FULL_58_11]|uniref:Carbohydrate kinase PfkB domain-containing protein n=1 Tax=Candidatus Glassbacteria bacterium RIFCSPLOWO2_12_FULL_58_11 TaxID=1817867 RepID=A0A1F5YZR1_9BACT|nr:MAG: hypothetical protein A3F83_07830 [Candidatus Glassbacteria bacterium RIFCSPLOWO2_12_FULL_58_11]